MKKGLLFIGTVITSIVVLFTTNEATCFPHHSPHFKNGIGHSISIYQISEPGLPSNHSQDGNAPVYKASPSFSALSSTYFIRLPHQGYYSHQPLFEIEDIKNWSIREPSALHNLQMILSRDVISPNAP